jgi:hypothetical protein
MKIAGSGSISQRYGSASGSVLEVHGPQHLYNYYLFPNVADPDSLKPDLNTKPDFLIVPGPGPSDEKNIGI